jgi:hypothetical protein
MRTPHADTPVRDEGGERVNVAAIVVAAEVI